MHLKLKQRISNSNIWCQEKCHSQNNRKKSRIKPTNPTTSRQAQSPTKGQARQAETAGGTMERLEGESEREEFKTDTTDKITAPIKRNYDVTRGI